MSTSDGIPVKKADIAQAMKQISASVRVTPTLEVQLSECVQESQDNIEIAKSGTVILKLEYLQHSGSFKARGAFNNLLTQNLSDAGVVAASGGNHGAAVAFAASQLGVPAHIFVPTISTPAKQARIKQFGAQLMVGGDGYADALVSAMRFAEDTGAIAIHAYDSFETITGAGTTALELIEQAPNIDTVLVAVGGGRLIGGMAAYLCDDVKIVAVETDGTNTLSRALETGYPVDIKVSGIASDSLGARRIGSMSFAIAKRYVDESVLVSDDHVRQAQA